jgi:uncharacterized protein (TIGR00106 family)
MALMQITIIPLGTKTPSVGEYVADVQELLAIRGVEFVLNDMGTVIHGEPSELLSLAAEIHEQPFTKGAQRVVTQIVLDDRRDRERGLGDKRAAVLEILDKRKQ